MGSVTRTIRGEFNFLDTAGVPGFHASPTRASRMARHAISAGAGATINRGPTPGVSSPNRDTRSPCKTPYGDTGRPRSSTGCDQLLSQLSPVSLIHADNLRSISLSTVRADLSSARFFI